MAIDLTGITNENEFYSHHYLSALLEDDLKDVYKAWGADADEETDEPWRALQRLGRPYLTTREEFRQARSAESRIKLQRRFVRQLLPILGYEYARSVVAEGGAPLPLLGSVNRGSGAPLLWILEAFDADDEGTDPLDLPVHPVQLDGTATASDDDLTALINDEVFFRVEPPRWALVVSMRHILLFDRSKWSERRALRFDLDEILSRREASTLRATGALLRRDSTCPPDGLSLLDTLDEKSHEHAYSVSKDLKYALRESVELLGNEAVRYLREVRKDKVFDRNLAEDLTGECLRYMYRLLFLFYIESRRELGYAPLDADAFVHGYSLQKLRDLEMVRLESESAQNGFFLDESIRQLFDLIYGGYPKPGASTQLGLEEPEHHTFRVPPLKSHLFDPERTPILNSVKLRNSILQRIIRRMSLTDPDSTRGGRVARGRISYAQLGINQLGAVYEALLTYRGFFAESDLFEVKKKGEKADVLDQAFFVPADALDDYDEDEKVFEDDGTLRVHPKGRFIYRLAGRDREKSASYYTPEVLTQCLVKYALKELLADKSADEILALTICEPAMGSAAFLNEAISQLADAYLLRKQTELGEALSPDDYATEKQRVKMYLADNNVYGVDLNPVAVELAEVSLWLNTLVPGGFVPWFGNQLKCGNSLVGARSQVFRSDLLRTASGGGSWLNAVPEDVPLGTTRPDRSVYHFLVPDPGMAAYGNKVIKELVPDEIETIKQWKKGFTKAFSAADIRRLERLSAQIDVLWRKHVSELRRIEARTSDPFAIFGHPDDDSGRTLTTTREKDAILNQELYSEGVRNSSPYRRLKLVMDYWCALWFWPIEKAHLLPSREEYLTDLELLLVGKGDVPSAEEGEQGSLFPDTMPRQLALQLRDELGFIDIDRLIEERPRLAVVRALGDRYHFHHWQLEFANVFTEREGFDLVLGNPPWIKLSWSESGVMSDAQPLYAVKKFSASRLADLRDGVLSDPRLRKTYVNEYEEADATATYLNSLQNYPLLEGAQTNLYKCFIVRSWNLVALTGEVAMLAYEGTFNDPNGGVLRQEAYLRLRHLFFFRNELGLFKEIGHAKKFEAHVYGSRRSDPCFEFLAHMFHPSAIDSSYDDFGAEDRQLSGVRDEETGKWSVSGSRERIVRIDYHALDTIRLTYEPENHPLLVQLPWIYSTIDLELISRLSRTDTVESSGLEYVPTVMWDESRAQSEGIIGEHTGFPSRIEQLVVTGPHIGLATFPAKTPRRICTEKNHYDMIDLGAVPRSYLPRSKFQIKIHDPQREVTSVPWKPESTVLDEYRLISRKMIGIAGERTLLASILPPGPPHIDSCFSAAFRDRTALLSTTVVAISIVGDYLVRSLGKSNFRDDTLRKLPYPQSFPWEAVVRCLGLVAATEYFSRLWSETLDESSASCGWSRQFPGHDYQWFTHITAPWHESTSPLRTDIGRRQALVEIDVLIARQLGLTMQGLIHIYRTGFSVLRKYESETYYDACGRIVFTPNAGNRGMSDLVLTRRSNGDQAGWDDVRDLRTGVVTKTFMDDTLPGGPIERIIEYHAPFDRCDREEDYAVAWEHFEKRLREGAS